MQWKTQRRIGLMGGTFDPIHYAHLIIAEEVHTSLHLTETVFIPAGQPPHKQHSPVTPVEHRLEMLRLALSSNSSFSISRIEVDRAGPSYLVDTLRQLQTEYGSETELYFIIGWDSLKDFHHWFNPLGILNCLTALVTVRRPGYGETASEARDTLETHLPALAQKLRIVDAPLLEIASTDLRQRVATGRSIKYQVPESVEDYIFKHGLYRQLYL